VLMCRTAGQPLAWCRGLARWFSAPRAGQCQDPPGAYVNNYGGRVLRIGNVSACFLSI